MCHPAVPPVVAVFRFKSRNDKTLRKDDLPHLNVLARESLELRARVITTFGDKANWPKELER